MEYMELAYKQLTSNIQCDSQKTKDTKISEDEEKFIKALILACSKIGMSKS